MEKASNKLYTTEQQSYERRTNLDLTWFADTCWEFVFENDRDGNEVSGSSDALLAAVRAGKRIKVRIGRTFHQANFITVSTDDIVTIQASDSMNDNLQDPTRQWLFVSTSGKVTTVRHKISDANAIPEKTDDTMALCWFVELRDWSTGSGELQWIKDNAGGDFRLKIIAASELYFESEVYLVTDGLNDALFHTRHELVEKNGIFYHRSSAFWMPSKYAYNDYTFERANGTWSHNAEGSQPNGPIVWFIGM
ncbi:uncharacterized protein LOC127878687 [Dreissena polymorpha]|uniref:Uncharacterized protein n=1 Tax=Dreissena polymorpha TaxID=45954 RepID=A0A9D4KJ67_DREPO|nr:uncharacterized protein LOC127878687 [Dreissena polymorpha]KAH3840267.1 hypothetical protein DPMN_113714 [Dreissena polymorpha]